MLWVNRMWSFLRGLIHRQEDERELDAEVRGYAEMLADEKAQQGMSEPEARRAARMEMGGIEQVKEEVRSARGGVWLETLWQDMRFGARMLRKSPGFTAVAVLTLALGIGATTAVFSVVNTVLLKPLPYADPDRLMTVESTDTRRGLATLASLSYPDFFDFRAQNHAFEHLITSRDTNVALTGVGQPQQLDGELVTWDVFPALGITPQLGRGFLQSEEQAGARVVVLSHALWQSQFGGAPDIVGHSITLNREPYTVVGVAPSGFAFPVNEPNIQLWTTIAVDREAPAGSQPIAEQRGARLLTALGRLKHGVSAEQARADLNVVAQSLAKQYPDTDSKRGAAVVPALQTLVGDSSQALLILLGAVGMVLLIACANIANLLLARATSREHEIALRTALGASRGRVLRQLLIESLLLALLGGVAGIVLAEWALQLLLPLGGQSIPRLAQATIDSRVLGFSLLLTFATSLLFGMAPSLQALQIDLTGSLKQQGRGAMDRHNRMRGALAIAQVTLGIVLVTGAGLLMASFLRLRASDLGLKPGHLLTFRFSLPESQYTTRQQVAFCDQLLERMRELPGVQSAAGVWPLPLGGDDATVTFNIEERPSPQPSRPSARMAFATPDYFRTADIPLIEGRFFTEHDDEEAPPVLIVNKAFADRFFPGEDAIGKRIAPGATRPGQKGESMYEIVGVVGSAKLYALDAEPKPIYYFPYKQLAWMPPVVMLRTSVPPQTLESAIRNRMAALDPLVPVFQVRTMDELLSTQVTEPRFRTLLLSCFAGIALLLTMVGLYGVMSYAVAQRTREFGIRMALGARREDVLRQVLWNGTRLAAAGIVAGVLGSLALTRLLKSMLFGIRPTDPLTLASAAGVLAAAALLACYIPARRATKVDPMVALRYE